MGVNKIAGMSMKGGRKDNFFFCFLEHFPNEKRWFLRSLLQVKDDEEVESGDDAIRTWIEKCEIDKLILDFPLSDPACETCKVECPGIDNCPVESIQTVQQIIAELLREDQKIENTNPKKYEQRRNQDDEVDFHRDILSKIAQDHMLSRSFKRKLKKGFLPYWNREIDFWIWSLYYDQLLNLFNTSFDSFGNVSKMTLARFSYLRRHLPEHLELFEANYQITLLELFRSKIISKKDIKNLMDIEVGVMARLDIIKKIESALNIFIYDHDLELLAKNPRAFESFILAIAGQNLASEDMAELPSWTNPAEVCFIIPSFQS